ncbi:hypothetical protein [Demequina sp.]|nr:hypothetical protein [Demequina sp.]
MRASRLAVVVVACGVILAVGYAAAPEPLPMLELVTPASTSAPATQEAAP